MAEFLLRISFHNRPTGDDLLLTGRVYPAETVIKVGDWLVFGEMKVAIQAVEVSEYEGVILTISQHAVETLRRAGIIITKLYNTKIRLKSAVAST
jgi:hypothetical protein